jgi:hypothetical protein
MKWVIWRNLLKIYLSKIPYRHIAKKKDRGYLRKGTLHEEYIIVVRVVPVTVKYLEN